MLTQQIVENVENSAKNTSKKDAVNGCGKRISIFSVPNLLGIRLKFQENRIFCENLNSSFLRRKSRNWLYIL